MHFDAILSMCAYTLVTAAFYLLGAAVLHARGEIPEGYALIETLSAIYTESFGAWGKTIFLRAVEILQNPDGRRLLGVVVGRQIKEINASPESLAGSVA